MNYDVTASVLVNELNDRYYISPRDSLYTPFDLQSAIAAALRRAANEAAWDGWSQRSNCADALCTGEKESRYMREKYGPQGEPR